MLHFYFLEIKSYFFTTDISVGLKNFRTLFLEMYNDDGNGDMTLALIALTSLLNIAFYEEKKYVRSNEICLKAIAQFSDFLCFLKLISIIFFLIYLNNKTFLQ